MSEQLQDLTPEETVQEALKFRGAITEASDRLQGHQSMMETYKMMGDHRTLIELNKDVPELRRKVDAAEEAARNYAETHVDKLHTAALAEAALGGVEINHPDAIRVKNEN